jgi:hypothetical protein
MAELVRLRRVKSGCVRLSEFAECLVYAKPHYNVQYRLRRSRAKVLQPAEVGAKPEDATEVWQSNDA